jgi:hypothetical protein
LIQDEQKEAPADLHEPGGLLSYLMVLVLMVLMVLMYRCVDDCVEVLIC